MTVALFDRNTQSSSPGQNLCRITAAYPANDLLRPLPPQGRGLFFPNYRDTNGAVNVYGLCGFSTHWPGGHRQGTPSLTLTINLAIKILRFLFKREYAAGMEYCYLAEPRYGEQGISVGHDPELDVNQQVLKQAAWVHIEKVKDDLHVSRVIASLSQEEMEKFKINLRDAKV